MNKIKIAVWGISDGILRYIKKEIDPRKTEISMIIDNDKEKQKASFMNISVIAPNQIVKNSVDFFLVAALSAYEEIKNQLIRYGVSEERIQPFVTENLCEYCIGPIDNINVDFIYATYFQPTLIEQLVKKYIKIYGKYTSVPVNTDTLDTWLNKSSLISHACGGFVNGKKVMYSNSKEAFQYSMNNKFKLIECDMLLTAEQELLLAHDFGCFYEAEQENYTMLSANELLNMLKEYSDVNCMVDIKWNDYDEFSRCICKLDQLIEVNTDNEEERRILKKQIVLEVYDEETIILAKEKQFDMIFTQYRNPEIKCSMGIVNICHQYDIRAIAMPLSPHVYKKKFMKIITDKNIKIFVFSTNSIRDYQRLRKIGINGILTDYLTEKDLIVRD